MATVDLPRAPVTAGDELPLLVDVNEIAAALGISLSTTRRILRSGQLPSVLVRGCRRVRASDLRRFIDGLVGISAQRAAR